MKSNNIGFRSGAARQGHPYAIGLLIAYSHHGSQEIELKST